MKKYALLLTLLLPLALMAQQPRPRPGEKIKQLHENYITRELDLTPEQAKTFWPLYQEMRQKTKDITKDFVQKRRQGTENMTDAELNTLMEDELTRAEKLLAIKREYFVKFKQVLNIRQIERLRRAEKEFRKEVAKRIKERRGKGE